MYIFQLFTKCRFFLQFRKYTNCGTTVFQNFQQFSVHYFILFILASKDRKMNVPFGVRFDVREQRIGRYDRSIYMLQNR